MIEFKDVLNIIFTNPEKYKELTKGEKQKYFFLLNRRFAINFPLQANVLQNLKVNQSAVIDFWHNFLRKQYKYIPGWIYAKGVKKTQEIKEKKLSVSKETIKEYCKYMKLDPKSVNDAIDFFPEKMINELQSFEKILKQKIK